MAKTSSSNPAMAETVHRSTRTKPAEQRGGGVVAVAAPPGSTTTRQRVDRSLRKAPPETMPTLVALQRPPALPPIGPPPPYPRRTNRTPSLNPPAILAIHPQAPFGNAVSPLVDGDGSSVVGVAVRGGMDVLSGGDDSGDQVDPHEVDDDSDGFSEEVDNDNDYSGFSEDDDKKASWTTPLMRMMRTTTSLTLILRSLSLLTLPILTRGPIKLEDDGLTLVDPSLQTIAL